MGIKVVILAGGTGGARLAVGMRQLVPASDLSVIANTADDDEFWGLLVCPDIDAVLYRLAGVFNEEAGYGIEGDSFHVLEALSRTGEDTWFRIGDKDFATHLLRAELMDQGRTLTEASLELCRRFEVEVAVLPMSDQPVRTRFTTDRGELSFQEYFVRERLQPKLHSIQFAGIESARTTPEVERALREADAVVIGPSNPLISVRPMLELIGDQLPRERTIAVTPIVAGAALKGPTVAMMKAVGSQPDPVEVSRLYRDVAATFVLDTRDRSLAPAIEALGYRTLVFDTVMVDGGRRLAREILSASAHG